MSTSLPLAATQGGNGVSISTAGDTLQGANSIPLADRTGPPAVVPFTDAARQGFIEYLKALPSTKKSIMDVAKRARFRNYHANPTVKIHDPNPGSKQKTINERWEALHKYDIDSNGQLVRVAEKDGEHDRLVAFDYDAFSYIEKAHHAGGHNGVRKTHQLVMKTVWGITRRDVGWVLAHCKV
jgi:hypothetical protein